MRSIDTTHTTVVACRLTRKNYDKRPAHAAQLHGANRIEYIAVSYGIFLADLSRKLTEK
jgi:hypothetical protein